MSFARSVLSDQTNGMDWPGSSFSPRSRWCTWVSSSLFTIFMAQKCGNTLQTPWCLFQTMVQTCVSGVLWPRSRCWCLGIGISAEHLVTCDFQASYCCLWSSLKTTSLAEIGRTMNTNNDLQVFSVQELNLLVSLVSSLIELRRRLLLDKMARGLQNLCVCVHEWIGMVRSINTLWYRMTDVISTEGPIVSPRLGAKSLQMGVSRHQHEKKCIKKSNLPHTTLSAHKRSRVAVYPSCLQKPSTNISKKCLLSWQTEEEKMSSAFSFSPSLQSSSSGSWRVIKSIRNISPPWTSLGAGPVGKAEVPESLCPGLRKRTSWFHKSLRFLLETSSYGKF